MKKLILFTMLLGATPAFACSAGLFFGSVTLNGRCVGAKCSAAWLGGTSTTFDCDGDQVTVSGSISGEAVGSCLLGIANVGVGGTIFNFTGSCAKGGTFSGSGYMPIRPGHLSCQANTVFAGAVPAGDIEVTGSCF